MAECIFERLWCLVGYFGKQAECRDIREVFAVKPPDVTAESIAVAELFVYYTYYKIMSSSFISLFLHNV